MAGLRGRGPEGQFDKRNEKVMHSPTQTYLQPYFTPFVECPPSLPPSLLRSPATGSLSLGSMFLVGEPCTFSTGWTAVIIGAALTALRIKSCLLWGRHLAWWSAALCSACPCKINWPCGRPQQQGDGVTQERGVVQGNLACRAIMMVYAAAGSDAGFLQVGKVSANKYIASVSVCGSAVTNYIP